MEKENVIQLLAKMPLSPPRMWSVANFQEFLDFIGSDLKDTVRSIGVHKNRRASERRIGEGDHLQYISASTVPFAATFR